MKKTLILFFVATLLFNCSSTNPEVKANIDKQLSALTKKSRSFEPPIQAEPLPPKVGQWVKIKTVDKKGLPGFSTYKIIGEQDGAIWYEVEQEQYSGRSVIKMLIVLNRSDISATEIRQVIQWHGKGKPIVMDEAALALTRGMFRKTLNMMTISWENMPKEDVTVPAGEFKQSFKFSAKTSIGLFSFKSENWCHPEVPINGIVKSEGENGFKMELVDFGHSGATSVIP